ncbi:MAG: ribosome-associated translation inhibitor RaiA [bacterium]|nr:ribosome-associated translation inhibitor RaiA [bacterium]MDZ4248419.1 ribosome-associated translation inhibitor RaiA [Patescibacteria group bacterium]
MKLQIKAVGLELTDSVQTYVTEKIGGLERFILQNHRDSAFADVKLIFMPSDTKDTKDKCHVIISGIGRGNVINAEEEAEDMHVAIDRAAHTLKETIRRHEDKKRDHINREARDLKEQTSTVDESSAAQGGPGEGDRS